MINISTPFFRIKLSNKSTQSLRANEEIKLGTSVIYSPMSPPFLFFFLCLVVFLVELLSLVLLVVLVHEEGNDDDELTAQQQRYHGRTGTAHICGEG